jgi:transposase
MVAAIGTGDAFLSARGSDWCRSRYDGRPTILGKISRRGNRYLRVLFIQAAWVVLVRLKHWEPYGLKSWIEAAKKQHHNVLAIALANKLARIAWAVLNKGRAFACVKTTDAMASRPA